MPIWMKVIRSRFFFLKKYLGPQTVERARIGDRPDMTVHSGMLLKVPVLNS